MAQRVAKQGERRVQGSMRDPFMALRERMERLLDDFSGGDIFPFMREVRPFEWRMQAFVPSVDIKDEDEQVRIEAELPGVTDKDVEVSVSPDAVILRGEKKQETGEKEKGYYLLERS